MKGRLQVTLFCYKPFFLHDLHTKRRKVSQKTRSALAQASVPFKGQRTKHTNAKRPFVARIHHFYKNHSAPCLLHKSLQNHCFQFLLEKLKTMVIAKFWGVNKVHTPVKMVNFDGDIRGARQLSGVALA